MPPKKSTKVLKERHPITCNLSDAQYREVQTAIVILKKQTGLELKPGTYATHALLSYPKHRATIDLLARMVLDAKAAGLTEVSVGAVENALRAVLA